MNGRERFRRIMQFESADRVPYWEPMGVETATLTRWHREGLPADVHADEFFKRDVIDVAPLDDGPVPAFSEDVLDYKNGVVTRRDRLGRVCREKAGRLIEIESFPLKTRGGLAELLGRLRASSPLRFPRHWARFVRGAQAREDPLGLDLRGPLGRMVDLAGPAWTAALIDEDPDFLHEALDAFSAFTADLVQPVLAAVPDLDFVVLRESLYGRAMSPRAYETLLASRHERLVRSMRDHGVEVIALICGGDLRAVVGPLVEAGFTALGPMDTEAGMDPVALRREHGQALALLGGIDAGALARDGEAVEHEVAAKAPALLAGSGWIPSLDRPVPPDVPLENYRVCWDLIRDLVEGG